MAPDGCVSRVAVSSSRCQHLHGWSPPSRAAAGIGPSNDPTINRIRRPTLACQRLNRTRTPPLSGGARGSPRRAWRRTRRARRPAGAGRGRTRRETVGQGGPRYAPHRDGGVGDGRVAFRARDGDEAMKCRRSGRRGRGAARRSRGAQAPREAPFARGSNRHRTTRWYGARGRPGGAALLPPTAAVIPRSDRHCRR